MTVSRFSLRSLFSVVVGLTLLAPGHGQTMDKEVSALAEKVSKTLVAKRKSKVAVIDFTDLQGRQTELGRYLAEQLSVDLVNAPGMSVVDRANLKSILAEYKLSDDGLINAETAKKLGQFAGIDAIMIGTVTSINESLMLTVKAISTETAEIIAASKTTFPMTKELLQFSMQRVSIASSANSQTSNSSVSDAIATKDFGDFRVTLKAIQRVKVAGHQGAVGLRCILEFTNKNLTESLVFACNGEKESAFTRDTVPRVQITNSAGNTWSPAEVRGVSIVRVDHGGSPTAIAEIIMYGQKDVPGNYHPVSEKSWTGNLTVLPAGESVQGIIAFEPSRGNNEGSADLKDLQFDGEFFAASGTILSDGKLYLNNSYYRLNAVIWPNLKISGDNR